MHRYNDYVSPQIFHLELCAEGHVMLTQSSFDSKNKTELIDWDTTIEL